MPCETIQMLQKIDVIFYQLWLIGCNILNVTIAQARYYTSLNMQSVIFYHYNFAMCDKEHAKNFCVILQKSK
jgi:hypothetical protein